MTALDNVVGQPLQLARKILNSIPIQFVANQTTTRHIFGLPPGVGPHRIEKVAVSCSAVPNDADGNLDIVVRARDVSEGAFDTIVAQVNLEGLVTAADRAFALALAAETAEKERIVEEGDVIDFQLISNSAAIDANPFVVVTITLIPLFQPGDQNVQRRGSY